VSLSRLLSQCQKMAAQSQDLAKEWRFPSFLSACEEMFSSLPRPPDPHSPPEDRILEYRLNIDFLKEVLERLPKDETVLEEGEVEHQSAADAMRLPLPHGAAITGDTITKQIHLRTTAKQDTSDREQLLGGDDKWEKNGSSGNADLDKLMEAHRDEQEKAALEMLELTRRLKEQTSAANSIIRKDTANMAQDAVVAENNYDKLRDETDRVGQFRRWWNCRCWIWLMIGIVIITFISMVMMMKMFRKKPVIYSNTNNIKAEL